MPPLRSGVGVRQRCQQVNWQVHDLGMGWKWRFEGFGPRSCGVRLVATRDGTATVLFNDPCPPGAATLPWLVSCLEGDWSPDGSWLAIHWRMKRGLSQPRDGESSVEKLGIP